MASIDGIPANPSPPILRPDALLCLIRPRSAGASCAPSTLTTAAPTTSPCPPPCPRGRRDDRHPQPRHPGRPRAAGGNVRSHLVWPLFMIVTWPLANCPDTGRPLFVSTRVANSWAAGTTATPVIEIPASPMSGLSRSCPISADHVRSPTMADLSRSKARGTGSRPSASMIDRAHSRGPATVVSHSMS
jgi:hypothetical protein